MEIVKGLKTPVDFRDQLQRCIAEPTFQRKGSDICLPQTSNYKPCQNLQYLKECQK